MKRLWTRVRLPLAIFCILLMTIFMARLFSGPEDGWVQNENGEWIAHGVPVGPPPDGEYRDSSVHLIVPVAFLVAFAVPLFMFGVFKSRDRLTYNTMIGDQKLFGYLGISFILFGVLSGLGLCYEMIMAAGPSPGFDIVTMLVIGALTGFALFSCLLGVLFFAMKRITSDHYQIMKGFHELTEKVASLNR